MSGAPMVRQRTPEEVLERLRDQAGEDFFGFRSEVLLAHLPADVLTRSGRLKADADLSGWEPSPLHTEAVAKEMADYMSFAWEKVRNHRGISASRSVEKIAEYLWLLGADEVLAEFDAAPYAQYGAPQLDVACRRFQLPIPDRAEILRMIAGHPCRADCDEGCGL